MSDSADRDRGRFYQVIGDLARRLGRVTLADCHGRMPWPARGVYFFFEPGEVRPDGTPRVVRVGTHAVSAGSRTTLWHRLSQHRGKASDGGGNHRGSIFRRHVGAALLASGQCARPARSRWGEGGSAARSVRLAEVPVEQAVSAHIRSMPFVWIEADDEPGVQSVRALIERHSIALLSGCSPSGKGADQPSPGWLGRASVAPEVRSSGLWNVRHVEDPYDPGFLDHLETLAKATRPLTKREGGPRVVALVGCVKKKRSEAAPAADLYTSPLFRKSRAYAERHADAWFVLSAKHGLLRPEEVVEPYDETLATAGVGQRRAWAAMVREQMAGAGLGGPGTTLVWLAGERYRDQLQPLLADCEHQGPLDGMKMGERLRWLNRCD